MKKTLEESIRTSKSPIIVNYFSQGFNMVFKKPILFVGIMLLLVGISYLASKVVGLDVAQSFLLQPLLMMGIFIVADKVNYQEEARFDNFFDGFKSQVVHTLLSNLLRGLAVLPALGIMGYAYVRLFGWDNVVAMYEQNQDAIEPLMFDFSGLNIFLVLVGVLLALVISMLFIFTLPMIRFRGLSAVPAMSASVKLVGRHFPNFMLFALLAILINLAGALLLIVGLLVTIPATYCAIYIAFDDLIEAREVDGDNEDAIMNHFIS